MTKNLNNYDQNVLAIKEKAFGDRSKLFTDDNDSVTIQNEADLLFAGLNKHHLFEETSFDQDSKFARELIYYQLLNIHDLKCTHEFLAKRIHIKGELPKEDKPVIYCSFHYGSYLHLFHAFKMLKRKFSFIIISPERGQHIVDQQKKQNKASGMYEQNKGLHQPKIIGAESLDNALEIYKTLKKESVVIFIDTFVKEAVEDKKRNKEIRLFNSKLFLHSGIPDISKKLRVPIIPVISERTEDNKTEVNFYKPVCQANFDLENYTSQAFQESFDLFSTHLKKYPEQWDQWQYLHNNLIKKPISLKQKPVSNVQTIQDTSIMGFNNQLFKVFQRDNAFQLLKIDDYQCFKVSERLTSILKELNRADYPLKEIKTVLNASLVSDLLRKQVLITKNQKN